MYSKVLDACALVEDIQTFPNGDQTVVGERGVPLSGGQRARASLARVVYKDADVYLLDDPLSALDTKVGQHIFKKCINGILATKVVCSTHNFRDVNTRWRVLTSHKDSRQERHMKEADVAIVMHKGCVFG